MKYKALLVTSLSNTKNKFWTCSISSPIGSLLPPSDLASTASVLRRDGIDPRILDIRLYKDPLQILRYEISNWKPDALIINMTTTTALDDHKILEAVKDKVKNIIVFGFHAMALPKEQFDKGATHILAGDPEYSVSSAVKGKMLPRGIWTKDNMDSEPGFIDDLDSLPFQALDLVDVTKYHSILMGKENFSILLNNRGCPYKCSYCVTPFLFGSKLRSQSPKRVLDEIEYNIDTFNIRSFSFIDSSLNIRPDWALEFCRGVLERGLKIKWCTNLRIPPVSRELLILMKKAGCFQIFYGVEDMDRLKELDRKNTKDEIKEAFCLARDVGIDTVAFIVLFPGFDTSYKSMVYRIDKMLREISPTALQCNIAIPFPGTQLYNEYRDKYGLSGDWMLYDPAGNSIPYGPGIDLVKVKQEIYFRFYIRNIFYVLGILRASGIRSVLRFLKNAFFVLGIRRGKIYQ